MIPISAEKLEIYLLDKYNINLKIDDNFIDNVLDMGHYYNVPKKGKYKNTLKIYKKKEKMDVKYYVSRSINNSKTTYEDEKYKKCNTCLDKMRYIFENKNLIKTISIERDNYRCLYYYFYELVDKHNNICNFFKNSISSLKKINEILIPCKTRDYRVNELDYQKIISIIDKTVKHEKIILYF